MAYVESYWRTNPWTGRRERVRPYRRADVAPTHVVVDGGAPDPADVAAGIVPIDVTSRDANLPIVKYEEVIGDDDLSGAVHTQARFYRLRSKEHWGARFENLTGEDLHFDECLMPRLTITGTTQLDNVFFDGCDLSDLKMTESTATNSLFKENTLYGLISNSDLTGSKFVDNDMRGVDIGNSSLRDTVFQGGSLAHEASISECDTQGAKFQHVVMTGSELEGDFRGVVFDHCVMRDMNATEANFKDADFSGSDLAGLRYRDPSQFAGATYTRRTTLPEGLDPDAAGMVKLTA